MPANPGLPKTKRGCPRKQAAACIPQDPLPNHRGRNTHPAGQLTPRHTTQQVAAEKELAAAEKESCRKALAKKIHEGEEAKLQFAQMNIAKEQLDDEMLTGNLQCLSVAICPKESGDGGEEFDFQEVDDGSSESSDDIIIPPVRGNKVSINTKICDQAN
jgi:hypothetical protein